jgi:hypothetical protein
MKLNRSKYLFFNFKRRRKAKIVGNDLFANYRFDGKFMIIDGLCIYIKSKKQGLLTGSFDFMRMGNTKYYLNIPFYLTGMLNYRVMGKTYGYKLNCSKLVNKRIKN